MIGMPRKMNENTRKLLIGILFILLSVILWFGSSYLLQTCQVPSGWNLINPLAWIRFGGCLTGLAIFGLFIKIGSIILFFAGIFKMIRG